MSEFSYLLPIVGLSFIIGLAVGRNSEGYLSIQDRAIMATLVNSVKELSARVEALEAENKKLKSK